MLCKVDCIVYVVGDYFVFVVVGVYLCDDCVVVVIGEVGVVWCVGWYV